MIEQRPEAAEPDSVDELIEDAELGIARRAPVRSRDDVLGIGPMPRPMMPAKPPTLH